MMTTYNVSIPKEKSDFFKEFLKIIGATYEETAPMAEFELTDRQKNILREQKDIRPEDCTEAEDFFFEMKEKYGL